MASWSPIWRPVAKQQFYYSLGALKYFQDPFNNCLCEVVDGSQGPYSPAMAGERLMHPLNVCVCVGGVYTTSLHPALEKYMNFNKRGSKELAAPK